ncbi:hypothetical protein TREMEDRAFT_63917 [Tremella mesenterica DSM 1558]|uniref:uncharacterized protein n=1 Tax=Tremella mesenterica (strain ATCC 24925 / CBS 8224 / DSM 1558 / NBRC 9311 / NRRL Y-6157 / RJB 2259-6 / UBC 559-6) TaxID=578456 RepID=UPI0003F48F1C|nr:uncharacterized protein TREMEDRAFT_63917 [Tremella mesenterica DSM 1558]EIW68031.1 hypothetical protein TREMEDRAFT_63917 [Tremella mesenterica DSM 1558]
MRLSVAPKFAGDYMAGVKEKLDGMIMRYVPQLRGVLLAHQQHEMMDDTVKIINECPFGVCEVEFEALVWAPKLGQRLYGTHSLSSPSHISLLFGKTFNVSIPLQHIPLDRIYFEHTDPLDEPSDSDSEAESETQIVAGEVEVGRWKERGTGKLVGEGGKGIKFTVIGLQVTNHMLSLTGSLLSDPSNPPAPPSPILIPRPPSPTDEDLPSHQNDDIIMTSPTKEQIHRLPTAREERQKVVLPAYDSSLQPLPANAKDLEVIDERFLNEREKKRRRKEAEKAKQAKRKGKKEAKDIVEVQEVGAGRMVDLTGVGVEGGKVEKKRKRKGEGQ